MFRPFFYTCFLKLGDISDWSRTLQPSWDKAKFKCEECDFVGGSQMTMEVHLGRAHSEHFECGLCEYESKSKEHLEMHLFTCETFICNNCDQRKKSLSEIKDHIEKDHENSGMIQHFKMARYNENEASLIFYASNEV